MIKKPSRRWPTIKAETCRSIIQEIIGQQVGVEFYLVNTLRQKTFPSERFSRRICTWLFKSGGWIEIYGSDLNGSIE
jgi:hypothetical protein